MNSTSIKMKKFLSNKNTVTIICAIIGIIVLYVGYQTKVNKAIQPVQVPYAKSTIQPRTKITDEDVGMIDLANAAVERMNGNIILKKENIIGYYSNINTMIPEGSFFYKSSVVPKSDLPDSAVYDIPEGHKLFYMDVNMATSYVNSIVPGGYIDIYIKHKNSSTGQYKYGRYIENVKVLAVKTSNGQNVFENTDEIRTPSFILFTVSEKLFDGLSKAKQLNMDIIPVPINVKKDDESTTETNSTSEELQQYIDGLSITFTQDEKNDDDDETVDDSTTTDDNNNGGNKKN